MDKVIIDGVDVSECSYYCKENEPYGCEIWDNECEAQNCYFKQFKRLERQYADVLKLAKENADSNEYCLQELEKENERLKEENYQLQKDCQICENFIDFIPCKPIRDMDYDLQKVISQRDNYFYALQDIRKICKNSHTSASENYYRTADKIQDKIKEVIGVE